MMRNYVELPGLGEILLEESFVVDIECHPGTISFLMDFVLTDRHADYRAPTDDEQYCYRRGLLDFETVTKCLWTGQGAPPSSDISGERDWGNVDSLVWGSGVFKLEGTWGQMEVLAKKVQVTLSSV